MLVTLVKLQKHKMIFIKFTDLRKGGRLVVVVAVVVADVSSHLFR